MVSAPKFSGENLFATPITLHTPQRDNLPSGAARPAMDPKTYPEWQASLLKQLVSTTKAASAVGSHDVSFERSIDSKFNSALTSLTDRLLTLSNRLLKFAGSETEDFEDLRHTPPRRSRLGTPKSIHASQTILFRSVAFATEKSNSGI